MQYHRFVRLKCCKFTKKNISAQGKLVDATQEFIALGMSNLLGSFFHSMPVAASFGRTAVNSASSAKTTLVSTAAQ
jgi:MFS superfamily sulfate permease-like transporter